ncbi:hypothetical protein Pmar_PMAR028628 [Perkinsus marinus ATCC 50983]|uniref:Uncharacterized protein n=1 Tax=Perkinsus marinus (strain ATCC 50983 / TXsc) TaxID=423536 RepID=C5K8F5_PERM5|nr:hypothetical protein Pmar_PMAR028628 [Perkinsus marinus ATCC 50983]EER19162.1 hypothetical protein Pmar_PMAR028628 [Perkinsus marinus ATCC 50983]|eukprot:XP_002787366.1 hypothetical protein Pmar_PMAR028628 [Perkinsus marinus ATCC 50983]
MKASSSDAAEEPTKGSAFYLSTLQPSTAVVSARAICEGKYLVVGRVASRIQIFGPFGKVGGEDFEAASADVMENGPLLEVPVMGRLMVMEVIRERKE